MNREVLSHYDVMTVGESGSVTVEQALEYASLESTELDMMFQFEHVEVDSLKDSKWTTGPVDLVKLKEIFRRWQNGLYGKAWNSLYWDNHDQPRAVSHFGCDKDEESRVLSSKMLGACLHMMQGTPYIYQGEELGMTNYPFKDVSESKDVEVYNGWQELVVEQKRFTPEEMMDCIRYKGRDNARTPMQWTAGKNAGFTDGEPWMPVHPNHAFINAESQVGDPDSVFHFYKKLIQLRKTHPIIVHGDFTLLMEDDAQVFAYTREYEGKQLLVACNFSGDNAALDEASMTRGELLIGNYPALNGALAPYQAAMLYYKD
jgi:oligo-1,6-glucosidase